MSLNKQITAEDIKNYRINKREEWARIFNKSCLWCGAKQHIGEGNSFCLHPFSQTWDRESPDFRHFEDWLLPK